MSNDDSIRLSPKHGVNPLLLCCFCCGKEFGVALPGLLPDDAEAPHRMTTPDSFCDECIGYMERGVILALSHDGKTSSGAFVVMTDEAAKRIFTIDFDKHRFSFISQEVWDWIQSQKVMVES